MAGTERRTGGPSEDDVLRRLLLCSPSQRDWSAVARRWLGGTSTSCHVLAVPSEASTPRDDVDSVAAVVANVFAALRAILDGAAGVTSRVAIVCVANADDCGPTTAAIQEACRGIVQSLTLELPPERLRCNVVLSDDLGDDLALTVGFLLSCRSDDVAGATMRLAS